MPLHPQLEKQDASVHELLGASLAIFTLSQCLLNIFIYSPREGILLLQLLILEDPGAFLPQAPAVKMFLMMEISSQLTMSI